MKFKKLALLLFLPILLLTSCGSSSFYGTYSFALGNSRDSKIGVELILKDELFTPSGGLLETSSIVSSSQGSSQSPIYNCKRKLDMNIYTGSPIPESKVEILSLLIYELIDDPSVTLDDIKAILSILIPEDGNLNMYYYVSEENKPDKGNRVMIGTTFLSGLLPPEIMGELSEILIETFIISYLKGKILSLTMPVSIDDYLFQLCWYGLCIIPKINEQTKLLEDVFVYKLNDKSSLPEGCGDLPGADGKQDFYERIGTTPYISAKKGIDEVEEMNAAFAPLFEKHNYTFRVAHTIPLELTKE